MNETLRLVGKAVVEDMNFSRVCLGRLPVTEVAALMRIHGERLLGAISAAIWANMATE